MIDVIYLGIVADYLVNATEEKKRELVNSHRAIEYFYLDNCYFIHQKDFIGSVRKYLERMSAMLNDTAIEVGLEDNETYYSRIVEELKQKHAQLEESKEQVEVCVPIGA